MTMPLSIRLRSVLAAAGALVVLMGPGCGSKGTTTQPSLTIISLAISPGSVQAGGNATGTVSLSSSAGGTVSLSTATSGVTVPGSVTVNAGSQTATFTVTVGSGVASGNVTVTGTINGSSASGTFSVSGGGGGGTPTLVSVSLTAASVQGGNQVTGTVTLSGNAPNGGLGVTLSSNNGAASVPGSVTVSAGQSTATFTVNTTTVGASTNVTIAATLNGVTQNVALSVTTAGGGGAPVASFVVRANVGGTPNECKFTGPAATLDCTFDASASTNAVTYFWRYSVGGNRIDPASQSSPTFRNPTTTINGNGCGLFNGVTGGAPTSLNMIVTLTVRSATGVDSAAVQNNNVKVLPSGTNCGF